MHQPEATRHQPPVAGVYVAGYGGGRVHALEPRRAAQACDRMRCGGSLAVSVCGDPAGPMPGWGAFASGGPPSAGRRSLERCPFCAWALALDQRTEAAELARLTPTGTDLDVLTRLLPEPLITVKLCEAILNAAEDDGWDRDHPHILQLLGHATAHAPRILLPEECSVEGCDHDRAGRTLACGGADAVLGCAVCSVVSGPWAGDGEGRYAEECNVPVPCGVLRTLAAYYAVAIDGGPVPPRTRLASRDLVASSSAAQRVAREDA
ncbi:hypothetical protein L3Q65_00510 (plasmid) [Amycolatopsis sp. FU40]|uniref:hypothetical protein n=1 Tax=Amycolatopsis sp. FU40 TaxID=2914159 RepID=UPI001F3F6A35|nr:hypothetical protein [Amycolatopsis sp. FU40]UKD50810.1 hypothetical protein L3Q65_00510 [Amycolatopsis sp. FU40]